MPTLRHLAEECSELQLRFVERHGALRAATEVRSLVTVGQDELLAVRSDFSHSAGALVILRITEPALEGATASAVDRMLCDLAQHRAAGLVVAVASHGPRVCPAATRSFAGRMGVPLLTTTAEPAAWESVKNGIRACRARAGTAKPPA
ncbi:hypothetical protein ACFWU3_09895 [Streptomyces sp. NPDC058685]|uniref:hypothetical protein n=1 Tax=Streptomyces sp. NPDC058685 TaxID=3346598 RepID=UPI0036585D43